MRAILDFLKQRWVMQLLGVLALCVLVWFAAPYVIVARRAPLAPAIYRLLVILAVMLVWLLYNLVVQARANRVDRQLIAELSATQDQSAEAVLAAAKDEEVGALRRKFEAALLLLQQTQAGGKRDRQYLYELPWYVIIGAPGSGKTTLLFNSGLRFPLSDRLGDSPVQGVGGTRQCDWFLANEAIFLDTAGRYVTQDSHQPVDAAGWHAFLELIKKYRPRRPINGVLVTLSMADLLQQSEEERARHAQAIRQRILELYHMLGVRIPIYMLFTKLDLIAGFVDFFADLAQEEREQVWGETFEDDPGKQTEDHLSRFDTAFDALLHRLNERTFRRIQEERDIQRRGRILDFPQQVALFKPAMMRFLHDAFDMNRFEAEPYLRGVYFTSGTQEGTPIDRMMTQLAATYGLDRQALPVASGRGRSFFITRLLKAVVIPEAGLAGLDLQIERRLLWFRWAAYASLLALAIGMVALWTASYAKNKRAIARVEEAIVAYPQRGDHDHIDVTADTWESGVKQVLDNLNVLRGIRDVYGERSWTMGFGLYLGDRLRFRSEDTYTTALRENLLRLIDMRLEQRMRESIRRGETFERGFEQLKVYLMLSRHPDKMDRRLVGAWLEREWERSFKDEPSMQAQLRDHSDHLLQLYLSGSANEALIAEMRQMLNTEPLDSQIYAHLTSEPYRADDFQLVEAIGTDGAYVFTTKQPLDALKIAGLYTYDGYNEFFKKQGREWVRKTLDENWVLENPAADEWSDETRLYDALQKRYFGDYERQWCRLLDQLAIQWDQGLGKAMPWEQRLGKAIQIIDRLSGQGAPLHGLLMALGTHTSLTRDRSANALDGRDDTVHRDKARCALASQVCRYTFSPASAQELECRFQPLAALVRNVGGSVPLDRILGKLAVINDLMRKVKSEANNEEQTLKHLREQLRDIQISEFERLPPSLKGWFVSLSQFVRQESDWRREQAINADWRREVCAEFKSSLQGRYPLAKNSHRPASLADFSRFFSPHGTLDRFVQERLKATTTVALSEDTKRQLDNASRIRDMFFPSGGPMPSITFELKPLDLDMGVKLFQINIEGQTMSYSHGPRLAKQFRWPGPNPEQGVRLSFQTHDGRYESDDEPGEWAWLKMLQQAIVETKRQDLFILMFQVSGLKARYELKAHSVKNPFYASELHAFRCPEFL